LRVNPKRIEKDIEEINKFNSTPNLGTTRSTFTKEYIGAIRYIIKELEQIGADIQTMKGGNLRARFHGSEKNAPSVMIGSHVDSVFQGGMYDGVMGTVAALEVVRIISENNIPHKNPIDFVVFAEEDGSRFSSVLLGSRIWSGKVKDEDLKMITDKDGDKLFRCNEKIGAYS